MSPGKTPDDEEMKRVAVLGGGPAGAIAAERLAAAGMDTLILDEKLAWEKPCGGGITYKGLSKYPFPHRERHPQEDRHARRFMSDARGGVVGMEAHRSRWSSTRAWN